MNRMKTGSGRESLAERMIPIEDRYSFLWLAAAAALLLFANGRWIIPAAAWLGPVFMVRFLRTRKAFVGLPIGYAVNAVLFYFQWQAAFQGAGAAFMLYTLAFGLIGFLPYVIDRLVRPALGGFLATLVLPAAWVSTEYLLHLVLPLGTFFSVAYTQSAYLPLLQIMSVAGLWGVTFLVLWFAGVANYAWERGFRISEAGKVSKAGKRILIFAGVLLAVVLYGGFRLAVFPPAGENVRVAVLTTDRDFEALPPDGSETEERLLAGTLTTDERRELLSRMTSINTDLLERSRLQARAGSRIVVWSEYDAHVFADDEADFLDACRSVARAEGIYMAVPLIVVETRPDSRPEPEKMAVNKLVMITPEGAIAFQYIKANLLIGWEMEHAVAGAKEIQHVDTPYGRLTGVICLDMDYPGFIRKAGRQDVDIVLSGAIDGTDNSGENPMHAVMASYRAIESGVNVARAGKYAQSMAVDYQGRTLAFMKHTSSDGRTLLAHVPRSGAWTLYTVLGDFFPWLCLAGLAALGVLPLLRRPRPSRQP